MSNLPVMLFVAFAPLAKPLANSAIRHAEVLGNATLRPTNKLAISTAKALEEKG